MDERLERIRKLAEEQGLDPDLAERLVKGEDLPPELAKIMAAVLDGTVTFDTALGGLDKE